MDGPAATGAGGVSAAAMVLPWDQPLRTDDLVGHLLAYVLGITALPWLPGYGTTRVARAVRARRGGAGEVTGASGP
ncbi:hypothetical protein ACFV2S_24850 [Streptomyces sp. NPDC059695]|uniref:hypothetical protein n=1 Tax=Streptomyces sp. NPDC059695 TaxID=3346910 RepID=UPI0036BC8967